MKRFLGLRLENRKLITYLIGIIPLILTSYVVFYNLVNIPFHDEHRMVLMFINEYAEKQSFWERLSFIIYPSLDNQHNNLVNRLFSVLQYHFLGKIDFRYFMLSAYLLLLAGSFIIFKNIKLIHNKVSVFFFSLCLSHYILFIWGFVAFQHFFNFLLFVLSFSLISNSENLKNHIIAYLLLVITAFNFGSGLVALYVLCLILLIKRNWAYFLIFSLLTILFTYLYKASTTIIETSDFTIGQTVPDQLYFLISLLGGWISVIKVELAFILGCSVFILFMFNTIITFKNKHFNLMSHLSFLFFFILISIAIGRSNYGIIEILRPRYSFYSLLFLFFNLILLQQQLRKRKLILLLSGVFIYTYSFYTNYPLIKHKVSKIKKYSLIF